MIDGLKPYPAMKDSGVAWLGSIPSHWSAPRLKSIFREVDRRSGTGEGRLLSLRMHSGLVDHHAMGGKPIPASSLVQYKRTEPGEVVMNRMRAAAGLFAATQVAGLVSPDYAVLWPRVQVDLRYFVHLFRTPGMMAIFRLESRGLGTGESGFLRLYTERFGMLAAAFPPLGEQAAIVRFLDYAERRIRRYVAAKQKLIKLLEEQKQAVIHRAVTGGLDPNVRLKACGVEGLDGVPEQWGMSRLKRVATVQTGVTLGKIYRDASFLVERPYLRVANVQAGRLSLSRVTSVRVPLSEARGATLRTGDVLMTEGGDIDKLGRGCVWHDEIPGCLHQNHIFAVRPQADRLLPEFLVALLGSTHGRRYFQATAKQTTNLAATNSATLGNFPVLLPELKEQRRILEAIAQESSPTESAMSRAEREIGLLHEYLRRLVADAVTGKFDVREAAAALPAQGEDDEAQEPEPGLGEIEGATGEDDEGEATAEGAEA